MVISVGFIDNLMQNVYIIWIVAGLSGDESSIGFMPYGINLPVSIYASKKNSAFI
jgi:hypothetical protein